MYIAKRTMKVCNVAGKMRTVLAGEQVPEASSWRNVDAYVANLWLEKATENSQAPDAQETKPIKTRRTKESLEAMNKPNVRLVARELDVYWHEATKAELIELILEIENE